MSNSELRLQCLHFAKEVLGDRAMSNTNILFDIAEKAYSFVTYNKPSPILHELPAKSNIVFPDDITPYDYQLALVKEVCITPRLIINKARQMGISMSLCVAAAHLARTKPNYTILFIGSSYYMALALVKRVRTLIPDNGCAEWTESSITLMNKSRIIAGQAASEDCYRGLAPDLVIIDEANPQLEATLKALNHVIGCRIVVASTPNEHLYKIWNEPDWSHTILPYFLCPTRDENFVRTMKDQMSQAEFRREFLCEF